MRETSIGIASTVAVSAARWIAARLEAAVARQGHAILGLPGGRSIALPLRALADATVPWDRVEIVFVDERHLPQGHRDRNDSAVDEYLCRRLTREGRLLPAQIHRVPFAPGDPASAARAYWTDVQALGNGRIDVALFGSGEDGHVASLFPGHPALSSTVAGTLAITDAPKPPPERITLSPRTIAALPAACVLFFGTAKRAAYRAFKSPNTAVADCPAKLLEHVEDLFVAVDDEADGGVGKP